MVGKEWWVLLGDDPKQKFPTGALWPSQHCRTDRSLQDPCRLSLCSSMASFQHCERGRWGLCFFHLYLSISFQRKCQSTGSEDITHHCSLHPDGKCCGENCWAYISCCRDAHVGIRVARGTMKYPHGTAASCSPGPLSPTVRYRCSITWITTYFWSYALDFLSLQTLKSISCESRYCFFIIWNKIQAPLSNVLPLNFDNA